MGMGLPGVGVVAHADVADRARDRQSGRIGWVRAVMFGRGPEGRMAKAPAEYRAVVRGTTAMRRGRSLFGWLLVLMGLSGCPLNRTPTAPSPVLEPAQAPEPSRPATGPVEDVETCVSAALQAAGLNSYGDPVDQMYAGGTPLFDERTGERKPRVEYVRARRPDLVARCEKR